MLSREGCIDGSSSRKGVTFATSRIVVDISSEQIKIHYTSARSSWVLERFTSETVLRYTRRILFFPSKIISVLSVSIMS